mmetsp:Transcript_24114/g.47894  ORF Transcript_24114/g.47894 Transcript_24114/m.47894 type:complete len:271 (-) Transcript_24114:111-923(-)
MSRTGFVRSVVHLSRTDLRRHFIAVRLSTTAHVRRVTDSPLTVVLDMDECLLHSQFLGPAPSPASMLQHGTAEADAMLDREATYRQHEPERGGRGAPAVPPPGLPACRSFTLELPDNGDVVHVTERPHLRRFLDSLGTRPGRVAVFTAAMEVYARPVLDVVDGGGGVLSRRFYREHCTHHPSLHSYVKDLNVLGQSFDPRRTVLVDNNPISFLAQPSNGILVSNFYDDPADDGLLNVLELLERLEGEEDVRTVLEGIFRMGEGLDEMLGR